MRGIYKLNCKSCTLMGFKMTGSKVRPICSAYQPGTLHVTGPLVVLVSISGQFDSLQLKLALKYGRAKSAAVENHLHTTEGSGGLTGSSLCWRSMAKYS